MKMRILGIGAHPDDIEIFMYGSLSAYKKRGDEIFLAIATDGAAGKVQVCKDLKKIRANETNKGLKSLGQPIFLNFRDGNLSNEIKAPQKIKNLIQSLKLDLIITHPPEDYHPDHKSLSNYVTEAAGFSCPVIFCETLMGVNFVPDFYVDITRFFKKKSQAILCHKSQTPKKFLDAVTLMNRYRSAQFNSKANNYAEVFRFEKKFPFSDVRSLLPNSPKINMYYRNDDDSLI